MSRNGSEARRIGGVSKEEKLQGNSERLLANIQKPHTAQNYSHIFKGRFAKIHIKPVFGLLCPQGKIKISFPIVKRGILLFDN